MVRIMQWAGQAVIYAGMALWLGYFANSPVYVHLPPDQALIKLSIIHGGDRKDGCRKRTADELAELAPNMRAPLICSRERLPVRIEILLDGEILYRDALTPAGLSRGGQSRAYQRFPVDSGEHELIARLVDSAREQGYDYERAERVVLEPGENFVIDFQPETGGFLFMGRTATASQG